MRGEHETASASAMAMAGSSPHARGALCSSGLALGSMGIIPACAGSTSHLRRGVFHGWDHPRMRGEHGGSAGSGYVPSGSSPHARGARASFAASHVVLGIIPACAGSTIKAYNQTWYIWDHPRMRGEHRCFTTLATSNTGSSPHARGAPASTTATRPTRGIIPACAGSTLDHQAPRSWSRDHPRMRGEHTSEYAPSATLRGSSPHARGALSHAVESSLPNGIIPACAGSTCSRFHQPRLSRDHPRMRGEHGCCCIESRDNGGSSPHARGALAVTAKALAMAGIIPACAGSTDKRFLAVEPGGDHPRMRGEHQNRVPKPRSNLGSSPHARGALIFTRYTGGAAGIIPACAGSTGGLTFTSISGGDHPRMRGEHLAEVVGDRRDEGSSPHARGALQHLVRKRQGAGIIPACAGSTVLQWLAC